MKNKTLVTGLSGLALALSLSMAFAAPVSAVTIFADEFNRSNSNTVGNSWVEINNDANDVAIINSNKLRLRGQADNALGTVASPDAAATRTISTLGFHDVKVQFFWAPLTSSEATDFLGFAWKKSSDTVFTNLGNFALGGNDTFSLASFDLGDLSNITSIDLRFWTNVNAEDEGARIDWVRVSAVPEPASFTLLGIGLLGLGVARRRKA